MASVSIPAGSPPETASIQYLDAAGNPTTVGIPADPVSFSSSDATVVSVTNNPDNKTASVSALKAGAAQVSATQGALPITPADVTVSAGAAVSGQVVIS